jgi:hypothetical protein
MAIDSTINSTLLNTTVILKRNINPNGGLYAGLFGKILKIDFDKVVVLFEAQTDAIILYPLTCGTNDNRLICISGNVYPLMELPSNHIFNLQGQY